MATKMHFFGFFEVGIGSLPHFLPYKANSEKGLSRPPCDLKRLNFRQFNYTVAE